MSYASSSDVLSERERYPNFWRTYPPETKLVNSVLAVMTQYNWKQVKIITQDEPIFIAVSTTHAPIYIYQHIRKHTDTHTHCVSITNLKLNYKHFVYGCHFLFIYWKLHKDS